MKQIMHKVISLCLMWILLCNILVSPALAQENIPQKTADEIIKETVSPFERGYSTPGLSGIEEQSKFLEGFREETEKELNLQEAIELNLEEEILPITLCKAVHIAVQNNYDIQIIDAFKEEGRWGYYNVKTSILPDVFYTFEIRRLSGEFIVGEIVPITVNETPLESALKFEWDILTGLRRYFDIKAARYEFESREFDLKFTTDEVIFNTTSQYYELLRSKLSIKILERNLRQTKAQLKITREQLEAGIGTKFDVLRAEAEVARSKQLLIAAFNTFRLNQAQLANTMGINVFAPLFPIEEDVKEKILVNEKYDLPELARISVQSRPDIKALEADVKTAEAVKKSRYSSYIPQLTLTGQAADAGNRTLGVRRNYALSLFASWTPLLGMGLEPYTDIKAKNEVLNQRKLELTDKIREIKENTLQSLYNTITAKEVVVAAREEVESARESLRLAFIRLEAGVGIFVDVLQSQATATTAKINLLDAIIAYNITQARLLFEMGVIDEKNVINGYNKKPMQPKERKRPPLLEKDKYGETESNETRKEQIQKHRRNQKLEEVMPEKFKNKGK